MKVSQGAKGRDERQGFDELIKGSVKKEWDIILVWDVSQTRSFIQALSVIP